LANDFHRVVIPQNARVPGNLLGIGPSGRTRASLIVSRKNEKPSNHWRSSFAEDFMHEIGGVPGTELLQQIGSMESTVRGLMPSGPSDELHTVNTELNSKILFESTQIATVLLDGDLIIRSFTPAVTTIFNLISADRGRPLTDIISHFETGDLRRDIRTVLESGQRWNAASSVPTIGSISDAHPALSL
jgi:hypothetical protein